MQPSLHRKGRKMAKEVEKTQSAEVEEMRPHQQMMRELAGMAELEAGDSFDIAAQVIDSIAEAQTAEEIFAANESGPKSAEDYLGQRIGLLDVRYRKSAERFRQGTLGVFAVLDAVDEGGEKILISVGAPNVVASVRRLQRLGLIDPGTPFWVKIKGRETENGTLYTLHAG